jgi:GNAT superfamily N-acetyltransferase
MTLAAFEIKTITSEEELAHVLAFCDGIFADRSTPLSATHPWSDYFQQTPELFVYAENDERIIGCVFGYRDTSNSITLGSVAVDPQYRRQGIAGDLLEEVENRARQLQYQSVVLGSVLEAEPFYLSCGYQPYLFVQAWSPTTLADLQALNMQYGVSWAHEADGWARLMLVTPEIDHVLQSRYDARFPGCSTQTIFIKQL